MTEEVCRLQLTQFPRKVNCLFFSSVITSGFCYNPAGKNCNTLGRKTWLWKCAISLIGWKNKTPFIGQAAAAEHECQRCLRHAHFAVCLYKNTVFTINR